jgi:hypothetical protein
VVGGADTVAGAAGGGDGDDGDAGDGIEAGVVGGAGACLERPKISSLTKELSDDIALSALRRTEATTSKYPKTCWPRETEPRAA